MYYQYLLDSGVDVSRIITLPLDNDDYEELRDFSEYVSAYPGDKYDAWIDYYTYGGLPLILNRKTDELKSKYLIDLCKELYLKDIEDRHNLRGDNVMAALVNILASAVGSLTNPTKLANTFRSSGINVSDKTIGAYIVYLMDAFFISKAERYDIKGKKYIASPFKYYFTDVGLRWVLLRKEVASGFFFAYRMKPHNN